MTVQFTITRWHRLHAHDEPSP